MTTLSSAVGATLPRHSYGHFQKGVPTGEMITVNASGLSWRTVANAAPGSSLHNDMIRWARTIKARGGSIQVAFGHEPETKTKRYLGTPEEYQAAYRKVVTTFRQQGVKNVLWVFQATDWGYRANPTASNYAPRYYPGDAYIDIVGADAYNWDVCGEGTGKNVSLSTVASGVLAFAKARQKKASLPEFAAHSSVDRSRWLHDGYAWLKANRAYFVSAFYFQHPPTNPSNADCRWSLSRASEYRALAGLVEDGWSLPDVRRSAVLDLEGRLRTTLPNQRRGACDLLSAASSGSSPGPCRR
ncbi:hypothetical protein JQN72_00450 [Phycicoccus sp. CSK15P-2]|uniref:glycosyl hydrolase n=1 Tax=Phycicoccus sp. CSK15P-2 TaxID=2807627 RepID=UPI00194ED596|nr:glycosyl hydrolase [Phycicoccus sp. CSK15P-2]MBM6402714.1 hypothetical protein [Phycicoccus sp. CSK15P-2]